MTNVINITDVELTDVELTEEEMHESGGKAAIFVGLALGTVVALVGLKTMEWYDDRKAKKNVQNEN